MRSLLQLLALLPVALTLATSPLLKAPEPRALSAPRNNVQLQREGVKNDAARPALAKRSPREGPWANYRHLRIRDGTVPPAKYSPLPVINGDTIEKSIQTQIKSDVNAVLQEFKSLPDYVNNLLKTALSRTLNQVNLKQTPEEQLAAISKSVDDAIEKIEKTSVPTALEAISAMDQTGDIKALQACLQTIIDMGGRRSDEDGTCLSNSGATLQSLKDQFNAFVEQNTFLAPANKVNAAADEVTKYLDDQVLVPSLEYLIGNATESLRNVVLTTAAKERDATKKVFQCFIDALTMIADTPYQDRQEICVEGGGTVKGSALGDIEEAYQARINQFAGVLPPNLVTNIQQIGLATLTTNIGPYEKATRDRINTAILSAAAASSGESATIVGNLIRCLNTIYDDTPTDTCNANRDPVVLQSNANVVRNYLAQFVSTLPKVLVEALRTTVESQLHGDTGPEAESLRADLQSLFERASLGTEYESCERESIDCTIQAMVAGTATTVCYEQRGPACQALPELSPEALDDPSNPYADIIAGLPGAGGWGGARRRAARRAANLLSGRLA